MLVCLTDATIPHIETILGIYPTGRLREAPQGALKPQEGFYLLVRGSMTDEPVSKLEGRLDELPVLFREPKKVVRVHSFPVHGLHIGT